MSLEIVGHSDEGVRIRYETVLEDGSRSPREKVLSYGAVENNLNDVPGLSDALSVYVRGHSDVPSSLQKLVDPRGYVVRRVGEGVGSQLVRPFRENPIKSGLSALVFVVGVGAMGYSFSGGDSDSSSSANVGDYLVEQLQSLEVDSSEEKVHELRSVLSVMEKDSLSESDRRVYDNLERKLGEIGGGEK